VKRLRDARGVLFLIAGLVLLVDRLSKMWVVKHVRYGGGITIIPKFLRISDVRNNGAAFSLFSNAATPQRVRIGLIIFSLFAIALMAVLVWRTGKRFKLSALAFALVLGGALGNLYDRAREGEVVDFIEVTIVNYHYPDFNLADSAIVIGGVLIFFDSLRPSETIREAELPEVASE
jgi:signal peptidase II